VREFVIGQWSMVNGHFSSVGLQEAATPLMRALQ
jgi:hypothetical protein